MAGEAVGGLVGSGRWPGREEQGRGAHTAVPHGARRHAERHPPVRMRIATR